MPNVNVEFTEQEMDFLNKRKGELPWHDYIVYAVLQPDQRDAFLIVDERANGYDHAREVAKKKGVSYALALAICPVCGETDDTRTYTFCPKDGSRMIPAHRILFSFPKEAK